MTTTQPSGLTRADRFMRALAWATQVGMASTYTAVIAQPTSWTSLYKKDPVGTSSMWLFAIGMGLLWGLCLYLEQKEFYDRRWQRQYRKGHLAGHATVLLIASLAAAAQPYRIALWALMAVLAGFTYAVWALWMRSQFLPAEDQAVIDAITARQTAQVLAARETTQKELRRQRLSAIVAGLGYDLTDRTPTSALPTDTEPTANWPVPSGKHDPLVYFIRNGNRVKIGTTTELKRRIRTLALRPENVALLLDGSRPLEKTLHDRFADYRIGDTEWFASEGNLTDFIADQNRLARKEEAK
ncbi:GIY-YIG nuclease family protein [Streptomyces sp. NPDC059524]|uniref:GIY-YIG nuclease family protein n=1 Tax=Streptomyces sp. NPDC059524 TaxID=3346856 RepID=UPI0036CD8F5C